MLSALNFIAQAHRKDRNTPAPASLAPPSRHVRRAFRSEPQITSTTPLVSYACCWLPPRPNPSPSGALQPPGRFLRSCAAAGARRRRVPPPPARPFTLSRQILNQRARLDPSPSNLSHPIRIQASRSKRTGSPCKFCLRAPLVFHIQPAVLFSVKIFTLRPRF